MRNEELGMRNEEWGIIKLGMVNFELEIENGSSKIRNAKLGLQNEK